MCATRHDTEHSTQALRPQRRPVVYTIACYRSAIAIHHVCIVWHACYIHVYFSTYDGVRVAAAEHQKPMPQVANLPRALPMQQHIPPPPPDRGNLTRVTITQ